MTDTIDTVNVPSLLVVEGTAPSSPASGKQRLYIDSADHHLKRKNSGGTVTDVEAGGGVAAAADAGICHGRLTLTSATPITTSDVVAAVTVYFTPYQGSQIATYSGSAWSVNAFTEQSLSLSGLTASTPYDIFIVDSTLALEAVAWTNDTTRATALVLQDGVYVKSGATTRRYLGTIRITGTTGQTEDSVAHRFVWNAYNRKARPMRAVDTTDNWSYNSITWREARAQTTNQVDYVCGLSEDIVTATVIGSANASSVKMFVGIGLDATNANSAQILSEFFPASGAAGSIQARYTGFPGIGYHYLAWIEACSGSGLFLGDDGTVMQSGIAAEVLA